MSEGIPPKKDGGFGTGAFKKAFEKPKRFSENQKEKGQGARKKESSGDEQLEAILAKISAEEKLTGAKILNYLNDVGGKSASPEAIKQIMTAASQRADKDVIDWVKDFVPSKYWSQPTETPEKPPAPEQKPAVNEGSGKAEDIKAPPTAEDISPEDFEKKLRQSVADWQEKRAKGEGELTEEPVQQEPTIETQAAPTVEAAPVAQTTEAAPVAHPEEEMDLSQRMVKKLAEEIPESTPQELKKLLRSLVTKVEAASAKGSERMKTLKEYLGNRLNELNGEAQEEGVVGRSFRFLGESYDKLDRKSKIAIGLSLGLGAGVLSAVSLPGAIACMSGIALQRIAGLSSAFLKYEKNAQDEKWGKEKAMAKAIGQAAFMTGGALLLVGEVKEGVVYLKEQHTGDATLEWLKQHWPSQDQVKEHLPDWIKERLTFAGAGKSVSPEAVVQARPQEEPPLVTQEEAEEHTRQVLAAEEGERLRETFGGPAAAAEAAKEASVHEVAPSPFEETDKHIAAAEGHLANIRKLATEQQAVLGGREDVSPDISLPVEGYGADKAQENFNTIAEKAFRSGNLFKITADTPLHNQAAEAISSVENDHSEVVKFKSLDASGNIVDKLAYWDGKNVAIEAYWDGKNVAIEAPFGRDANDLPFASEQEAKDFADLKHATHDPRATGEWPGGPAKEHPGFFENLFGTESPEAAAPETFEIPATEAHVYATDSNELFAYGGSWEKQEPVIRSYLEAHPKETVFSADAAGKHRIPWSLVDGRLTPGTPVRTGGFLGFGSSWAEAPDPKEFTRVVPLEHSQPAAPDHTPQAPVVPEKSALPAPGASRIESVAETAIESESTGVVAHEFEHLKFGSAEGTFKYSPSGSVQGFRFEGTVPNPQAAESLLNENYQKILSSRPGANFGLDQRTVSMNALRVSQYQEALDELTRRGADKSPEADFLRKGMRRIIDNIENKYGDVFKN